MNEREKQSHPESVKHETIIAINAAIDAKFSNPTVVREDPTRGVFVLDDADQNGHNKRTQVEVIITDSGKFVRFIEFFDEVTPRYKPSILVYDYDLDEQTIALLISKDDGDDQGTLARKRLEELRSGGTVSSYNEDELLYTPSESQAQKVLASLNRMKIFIGK